MSNVVNRYDARMIEGTQGFTEIHSSAKRPSPTAERRPDPRKLVTPGSSISQARGTGPGDERRGVSNVNTQALGRTLRVKRGPARGERPPITELTGDEFDLT
jgi:hypothetical protein